MGICVSRNKNESFSYTREKTVTEPTFISSVLSHNPINLLWKGHQFIQTRIDCIYSAYQNFQLIGEGGFGMVYSATEISSGTTKAVKIIPKSTTELIQFNEEVECLRKCDHPNIIKAVEISEEEEEYCLVTEWCQGPNLFTKLIESGTFSERQSCFYIKQILGAIGHCHKQKIIHGDLKLENILFESPDEFAVLKLIDFGIAQIVRKEGNEASKGTIYYMAPENFRGFSCIGSDIWSCGVLLYLMLTGDFPFKGISFTHVLQNINQRKISFNWNRWNSLSDTVKDLILKCLTVDPVERISAEDALEHPWIQEEKFNRIVEIDTFSSYLKMLNSDIGCSEFEKAVYKYIGINIISLEEKNTISKVFLGINEGGDGEIGKKELEQAFENASIENSLEIDIILETVDSSKSGYINFSDFLVAQMREMNILDEGILRTVFEAFSENGIIGLRRLKEILDSNEYCSLSEAREVFNELSSDGCGISEDDFLRHFFEEKRLQISSE